MLNQRGGRVGVLPRTTLFGEGKERVDFSSTGLAARKNLLVVVDAHKRRTGG